MDNDKHAVFVGDEPCELTFKEYELLKYLMIKELVDLIISYLKGNLFETPTLTRML